MAPCVLVDASPSSQVALDALVGSLEHPVVLLLPKQDVGLQEVLVERVHARAHATLLAHPLACLDVHNVACRLGIKQRDRGSEGKRERGTRKLISIFFLLVYFLI